MKKEGILSIMLQKQMNSWKEKPELWLLEVGCGGWALDEGGQKAPTSSYKVKQY